MRRVQSAAAVASSRCAIGAGAIVGGVDDTDPGDELDKVAIRSLLVGALKGLTSREENIIRLRFGLSEDPSDSKNFPISQKKQQQLQARTS